MARGDRVIAPSSYVSRAMIERYKIPPDRITVIPRAVDTAAEAQAMGLPVVATSVGVLPENVLCPPRMRDDLRTGWLVRPGNVSELARAVASVLALDVTAYAALSARARQFAELVFSPHSVAEAIRGVYTSLLARDV